MHVASTILVEWTHFTGGKNRSPWRGKKKPVKEKTKRKKKGNFFATYLFTTHIGVTIVRGKQFAFTARPELSSFVRATNAVLNVLQGAHEHTLITLLYSNCVPTLTYACAVKEFSATDMSDCNTAMNNVFRKIFGFTDWRSVRALRKIFDVKSLYVIFKETKDRFLASCRSHHNPIVKLIVSLFWLYVVCCHCCTMC